MLNIYGGTRCETNLQGVVNSENHWSLISDNADETEKNTIANWK